MSNLVLLLTNFYFKWLLLNLIFIFSFEVKRISNMDHSGSFHKNRSKNEILRPKLEFWWNLVISRTNFYFFGKFYFSMSFWDTNEDFGTILSISVKNVSDRVPTYDRVEIWVLWLHNICTYALQKHVIFFTHIFQNRP